MLYHLFRYLNEEHGFPHLVRYPSFRIAVAFATALLLCVALGPPFIRWLERSGRVENIGKMGAARRALVPAGKAGTPTMGGLLSGAAVLLGVLLWCPLNSALVWGGLLVLVSAGVVGYRDDQIKVFDRDRHGLPFRTKLFWLSALGIGAGLWLHVWVWPAGELEGVKVLVLPFLKDTFVDLRAWSGLPFLLLVWLAVCGTSNAVNLTDGMDGLAAGCLAIAAIAMTAMNYVVGDPELAARFFVRHVAGGQEIAVMMGAFAGASLGFLWFNAAPAQLFLGDVGSLSLGALLGYSAVASRMELTLLIVGGVFVFEALSVVIQVGSYKLRGKRVFLCAPVHHHFQKLQIPETKIVVRFWCVAIVLAVGSIALFKVR